MKKKATPTLCEVSVGLPSLRGKVEWTYQWVGVVRAIVSGLARCRVHVA